MKENPTFVVKPNSDEVKGAVFPNIILGEIRLQDSLVPSLYTKFPRGVVW